MNDTNLTSSLRTTVDVGSLIAGLLFTAVGIAFVLEASGAWSFELSDFRFIGPIVLIVIGITTLVGASMARRHDDRLRET